MKCKNCVFCGEAQGVGIPRPGVEIPLYTCHLNPPPQWDKFIKVREDYWCSHYKGDISASTSS